MLKQTQPHKDFPSGALFVQDPVAGHELDMQPLLALMHSRYQGDKNELAAHIEEVTTYLLKEDIAEGSARQLRRVMGILTGLQDAFELMTVRKTGRV